MTDTVHAVFLGVDEAPETVVFAEDQRERATDFARETGGFLVTFTVLDGDDEVTG